MDDEKFLAEFDQLLAEANEQPEPVDQEKEEQENQTSEDQEFDQEEHQEEEEQQTENNEQEVEDQDTGSNVESEEEVGKEELDYKALYEEIMAPFKANGRTMELRSAAEARQLQQMGANYTQKMQEISKHRRVIATLAEHGIKEDADIQFLIDLKNKNPEAIQKYLKDSEIDPFDIDTSSEVNYKPQATMVSETTIDARSTLDELQLTDSGRETIDTLDRDWDNDSLGFLWNNPQGFKVIHEQRESGVYDNIMNEIVRQTTLGMLPPTGSMMEKYNMVGNQLYGETEHNTRRPIDTKVATQGSSKSSDARAKAAGSPRSSKRTSMVLEDMAKMNDDDFLKAMNTRYKD